VWGRGVLAVALAAWHRDRKTKTRQAFPGAGRGITTRTAIAQVSVCTPVAA